MGYHSDQEVTVAICGTLINYIGINGEDFKQDWDGRPIHIGAKGNVNTFRSSEQISGSFMCSKRVSKSHPAWGTLALTTMNSGEISYRTAWAERSWGDSILDFWDDFSDDGCLSEQQATAPYNQMGSLAVKKNVPPGETVAITFLLTWHFPNRHGGFGFR